MIEGHYHLPLPLRNEHVHLPNNREMVVKRALSLKRKLEKNDKFRADYSNFMNPLIEKGYAVLVDPKIAVKVWFHLVHTSPWRIQQKEAR